MRAIDTLPLNLQNFSRRAVITLHELVFEATFNQINPFQGEKTRANPFHKRLYMLPLVIEKAGGNWVRYRRKPFRAVGNL